MSCGACGTRDRISSCDGCARRRRCDTVLAGGGDVLVGGDRLGPDDMPDGESPPPGEEDLVGGDQLIMRLRLIDIDKIGMDEVIEVVEILIQEMKSSGYGRAKIRV